MKKLLIIDDDPALRGMMRMRLSDTFEVIDTEDPEQALALALEKKPDAVLLDLMMPKFSGFELCQSFRALTYTSYLPIFVISGQSDAKYKEHCDQLGAAGYFEKPIDFKKLKERLTTELEHNRPERRSEVRVRMRVPLRVKGIDANGKTFEELAETENVSTNGFLCSCAQPLTQGTILEVFVAGGGKERFAGKARVVRKEAGGAPWQRYGCLFVEKTKDWVLHE